MGRLFLIDLDSEEIYSCKFCRTELCLARDARFAGYFSIRGGRAYLFAKVVNVTVGEAALQRWNGGGMAASADILCVRCGSIVGMKFVAIEFPNELEGKFLLEMCKVVAPNGTCFFDPVLLLPLEWGY